MSLERLAKAATGVTVLLFVSKIFGFMRETVIAAYFGTSMLADAYQIATELPFIMFDAIAAAVAITFIPVYSDITAKYGENEARSYSRNLSASVFWIIVSLTVVVIIYAPQLIGIMAPGFEGEKYLLTVKLTRILTPLIIFRLLSGVVSGYLNARKHFLIPTLGGLALNFFIIGSTLVFAKNHGIYGLAFGALLGAAGMLLIQLPSAYKDGFRLGFRPHFNDAYIKNTVALSVPVFLSSALNQVSLAVDRIMASSLPTGAISALTYANRLNLFVLGIFITALTTVFFPSFAELASQERIDDLKLTLKLVMRVAMLIVTPMMVGLIVLRYPIVQLLFQRGAFDVASTEKTSDALLMYTIGLLSFASREILNRVFYALKDTKTPTRNAAASIAVNIVLNLFLVKKMGHSGLALATSASASLTVLLLMRSLRVKLGSFGGREILTVFVKIAFAAVGMGITAICLQKILPHGIGRGIEVLRLFLIIGIAGFTYVSAIIALGIKEAAFILSLTRRNCGKILPALKAIRG